MRATRDRTDVHKRILRGLQPSQLGTEVVEHRLSEAGADLPGVAKAALS